MTTKTKKETKWNSSIVTKKILVDRISNKIARENKLTKEQIDLVLSEYLEITKESLANGEEIRLAGYYTFKTTTSKPRTAFNLKTKAKMTIPAKLTPKIKFSKESKEAVAKEK